MRNDSNEDAAGGIITLTFVFLLSAMLFIIMSYGVDKITLLAQTVMTTNASQMRYDSLNIQLILFRLEPMILLLGAGINYWITESRQMSGITDLGGMLMSAVEMILGTFVMMLLCFFGGGALDQVTGALEAWSFIPQADMYTVTQFLVPVFYTFMTLIIVSIIALFLLKCVQIVDYAVVPEYT
jgi:hypothetical protein